MSITNSNLQKYNKYRRKLQMDTREGLM